MKKKRLSSSIFASICLVILIVILVVLFILIIGLDDYYTRSQRNQLKNEAILAASVVETRGLDYFDELSDSLDDFRITLIAEDGTVIYDSYTSDTSAMENHLDRPEVASAMNTGYGESSRRSESLYDRMLYAAVRLTDGRILRLAYRKSSVWSVVLSFAPLLIVVIFLSFIISLVLARYVTAHIVDPINTLNLDNPLNNDTYAELDTLITRIDQQQRELRADRAALERNEKIREEFTANVSHEMKTPLQTISGYAEIMQAGIVKAEDIRPFASKIYQESHRLSTLVEDIIDLTKLESDSDTDYRLSTVSIYSVALNVLDSLYGTAEMKNVSMHLKGEDISIYSEPEMLHSIIYNLCDNAIKYNKIGGSVSIDISKKDGSAILTVSDTGVGIPEESLDRIFERFYRVDKSRSKEVGGTGLGLSIVKHAVMILDASIKVESKVGKGSVFIVKFSL